MTEVFLLSPHHFNIVLKIFAGTIKKVILNEFTQTQKAKRSHVLSHLWNIDLTQMQQCYETLVRRSHMGVIGLKKQPKNLNMGYILSRKE
jgi:hypothetical protein